jgi:hypothetical protein
MANKRIKDLGTTASTLAADDYVAIDGNANGTRKIVKGDLVNDISTQVAGTYLDEANNLSDVASKDTSKLNLEVPDVGTAPNEVPMNGQLGSMAYQSAEAVSAGTVSADDVSVGNVGSGYSAVADELIVGDEDGSAGMTIVSGSGNTGNLFFADGTTSSSQRAAGKISYTHGADILQIGTVNTAAITIDSNQQVGIGTASPGSYHASADDLVIGDGSGSRGLTISGSTTSSGSIFFADGTSGADAYRGFVQYGHGADSLYLGTAGSTQWVLNSSGDLVSQGGGIDFGAVASGTGTVTPTTGGLLDDYESGTWTPVIAPNTGSFATATTDVRFAKYTKVGNVVTANCYIQTTGTLDTTGGSGAVVIQGLPFTSPASTDYVSVNVGYAYNWSAAPAGGYISSNTNRILLTKRASSITGNLIGGSVSDLDTGGSTKNEIMISVTYQTT